MFNTPYLAASATEFWRRWHISLYTWFRDYLYIALGGKRSKSAFRWAAVILAVFLASGLWHGANWTFVFWGGLWGVVYSVENGMATLFPLNKKASFSLPRALRILSNFTLVSFAWIFFRSQSVGEAFQMIRMLFSNTGAHESDLNVSGYVWVMLGILIASDFLLYNTRFDKLLDRFPMVVRWLIYAALIWAIVVYSAVEKAPFIYFRF